MVCKNTPVIPYDDFIYEMKQILASSVGSDYARCLIKSDGFTENVKKNVEETSAWRDEGYYNDDDIRLAIGRVLLDRLGIEY